MKTLLLTIALTATLLASSAHATLTQIDNTVFDDVTGLKWLKLTQTQGQTREQALANFPTFRHATKLEVCSLADYFYVGCTQNTTSAQEAELNTQAMMSVVSFFGETFQTGGSFGLLDGTDGFAFGCLYGTICAMGFSTANASSIYGNFLVSTEQALDTDSDSIYDAIDNCVNVQNLDQVDTDSNGVGDVCNEGQDQDSDEWSDLLDNCPVSSNDQTDTDHDGIGDACDAFPGDGNNALANCEASLDSCQNTIEFLGTFISADADADGILDAQDTCASSFGSVDPTGCTLAQFCAKQDVSTTTGKQACRKLDWKNDEPNRTQTQRDCNYYIVSTVYKCLPQQ